MVILRMKEVGGGGVRERRNDEFPRGEGYDTQKQIFPVAYSI